MEDLVSDAEKVEMIESAGKKVSPPQSKSESAVNDRSSNNRFKKSENKWGQHRLVEKGTNEWDAQPNNKFNLSFKEGAPKGKVGTEAKGKQKQLTLEQKNKYRAAGKCFECGETTHKARDCPRKNSIRGESKNAGPPGLSTNNIEWGLANHAHTSKGEMREFSANNVLFNWADDVEETYYSDSIPGSPPTEGASVDGLDNASDLPDLIPVSDSDSGDELDGDAEGGESDCWDLDCNCSERSRTANTVTLGCADTSSSSKTDKKTAGQTPRTRCLNDETDILPVHAMQIPAGKYSGIQRNAARVKDANRKVARPLVIAVLINGEPVTALLDSGSLGSFMSTTLVDQLKIKQRELNPPITLQLAVQGSRSKIN
ncbi:hypothetical protein DFH05DRAFT_1523959 [Lentinula detonsa]|uniref:CCHC-type domain-containing protein n=1 Tax=Lentinula detonsa TaxID=2804962 RepID=A0A9W8P2I8_9AGAR|nr:hypothetical protein DFH05DRAFT_1523959 [Lentinula detonsa]